MCCRHFIRWPSLAAALAVGSTLAATGCDKSAERIDLTKYVHVDPGAAIVDLHRGTARMTVRVRAVSQIELKRLRLEVKSEACESVKITPEQIERIIPGSRQSFTVELAAKKGKARQRYPLELTLRGDGLPVAAGLDLIADLRRPPDKGWIDVGTVKLVHRSSGRSSYYLLGALPLLLLVGWLLWHLSRRRARAIAAHAEEKKKRKKKRR